MVVIGVTSLVWDPILKLAVIKLNRETVYLGTQQSVPELQLMNFRFIQLFTAVCTVGFFPANVWYLHSLYINTVTNINMINKS